MQPETILDQGGCFQCGRREFDDMILHTYDCKYSVMERQLAEKDARIAELEAGLRHVSYCGCRSCTCLLRRRLLEKSEP
jgi:hypothetical protein